MKSGGGHNSVLYCLGGGEEVVGEDREAQRRKEVDDLISKYAKKKDKDEVRYHIQYDPLFRWFYQNAGNGIILFKQTDQKLDFIN